MLSLLSLLVLSFPCLAQSTGGGGSSSNGHYWQIVYTQSGFWSYADRDKPTTGQTTFYGDAWDTNGSGYGTGGGAEVDGSVSGTITATLTWIPATGKTLQSDPPPTQLNIVEYGDAWFDSDWGGPQMPDPSDGVADDGLGDAPVYTNGYGSLMATSQGYHVVQKDASSGTVTVTCSPSASNPPSSWLPYPNYPGYHYWDWTQGLCVVSFTVYPVTMDLAGTTPDSSGNLNILVGQGCTASLSGIPADLLPYTTYAWSVSDPSGTFQSWNGGGTTSPVVAILGLGPTNQPTAHWFWTDTAGLKTVTCKATVTPPNGQGSPFTLTVTEQVELQTPTYTANNLGGLGYIVQPPLTADYRLEALPTPSMINHNYQEGSSWRVVMSIPTPFNSSGLYGYAQIIKPGEYYTGNDGTENPVSSDNGQQGLDTLFPYLGDIYSADNTTSNDGDSPYVRFGTDENSADAVAAVRLADVFQTYLMFKPSPGPGGPADDAQWVPLAESDWHTDMGAGRPTSGRWKDFPLLQGAGDVYVDADFFPQTVHPYWTHVSGQ